MDDIQKLRIIVDTVSSVWGVSIKKINGISRIMEISEARQVAHKITFNHTKLTLKKIGEEIGGRHHATVINSIDSVRKLCMTDNVFRKKYDLVDNYVITKFNLNAATGRVAQSNHIKASRSAYIRNGENKPVRLRR